MVTEHLHEGALTHRRIVAKQARLHTKDVDSVTATASAAKRKNGRAA